MRKVVITCNMIEGYHRWPQANGRCAFLSSKHRHIFIIRCYFPVNHNDREIELITKQEEIGYMLTERFGQPCEFGSYSCEDIAEWLLDRMPYCERVEVLEDGYGGAALSR